jgi:hypothetical protein
MGEIIQLTQGPDDIDNDKIDELIERLKESAREGAKEADLKNGDGPDLDAISALIIAALEISMEANYFTMSVTAQWLASVSERLKKET